MVTGTAFNVRVAEDGDHGALQRGRVRLTGGAGPGLPLIPGEGAVMSRSGLARALVALDAELAWTQGRLDLGDMPLAEAAARIAPHMPGRVLVLPSAPRGARVSGSFRMAQPQAALQAIAAATGAGIRELPGGTIILY